MALTRWSGGNLAGKVDGLIFQNYKGIKIVRSYFIPRNPRTPLQQSHRNKFGLASKISATLFNQYFKGRIQKDLGKLPFNAINKAVCEVYQNLPNSLENADLPNDRVLQDTGDVYTEFNEPDAGFYKEVEIGLYSNLNWETDMPFACVILWNKQKQMFVSFLDYTYEGYPYESEFSYIFPISIQLDESFRHNGMTFGGISYYSETKGVSAFQWFETWLA